MEVLSVKSTVHHGSHPGGYSWQRLWSKPWGQKATTGGPAKPQAAIRVNPEQASKVKLRASTRRTNGEDRRGRATQPPRCPSFVDVLGPIRRADHDLPGWSMPEADRRAGLVALLSARSAGPIKIDFALPEKQIVCQHCIFSRSVVMNVSHNRMPFALPRLVSYATCNERQAGPGNRCGRGVRIFGRTTCPRGAPAGSRRRSSRSTWLVLAAAMSSTSRRRRAAP